VYLNVYQFLLDSGGSSRTIIDTKKPAGLAPCGLSGLLRMTLESSSKDFGGAGGIWTPVRNSYILGTTCLVSLYIRLAPADRHATTRLAWLVLTLQPQAGHPCDLFWVWPLLIPVLRAEA